MFWFINALLEWVVIGAGLLLLGVAVRRYAEFTGKDSNAPRGYETDWPGFFGRR